MHPYGTIIDGVPVEGTIQTIHQLDELRNIALNHHAPITPRAYRFGVRVHTPGGDRDITIDSWLPSHLHFRLASGMALAVVIDPRDPSRAEIDWWESSGVHAALGAVSRAIGPERVSRWPVCGIDVETLSGWPATGVIRSVYASGFGLGHLLVADPALVELVDRPYKQPALVRPIKAVRGLAKLTRNLHSNFPDVLTTDPVLALTVDVTFENGATLRSSCWHRVPPQVLPRVVPGLAVNLFVSPVRPERHIHITWQ